MSFLKPDAPPAPDYAAAALLQGVANRETAIANNALNRVNQYSPQGSLVWTMRPGADPNNPQVGDYTQTVSLSPQQQALYDYDQQLNTQLMQMAGGQLSRVQSAFDTPVSTAGLPGWQTSTGRANQMTPRNRPPAPSAPAGSNSGPMAAPAPAPAFGGVGGIKPTKAPAPSAVPAAPTAPQPLPLVPVSGAALGRETTSTVASEADRLAANQAQLWQRQQDREAIRKGTALQGTYLAPEAPGVSGAWNQPLTQAISDGGQYATAVTPVDQFFPMERPAGPGGGGGPAPAVAPPMAAQAPAPAAGGSGGFVTGGGTGPAGAGALGAQSPGGQSAPATGQYTGSFGAGAVPKQVDAESRKRVEEAILARLEPQYRQDESRMRNQLLSQGMEVGTSGYNSELDRLARAQNDARMQAVLAGGTEESRQMGLNASLQGQAFTQGLQGSQFDNQTRQQMLAEMMYMRNLPLNELNALRSGGQVSMPSFGGYYTNNAGAAPVFDAANSQANYNMGIYNSQVSGSNALLGGLASLGSAWLGA